MSDNAILIRNTADQSGRNISMTPDNTPLRFLSCGRVILDDSVARVEADSGDQEVFLLCLKGEAVVSSGGHDHSLGRFDSLFIPPGNAYRIESRGGADLVEASAPSAKTGQPSFIPFQGLKDDPDYHMMAGGDSSTREIYKLVDTNVDASRLLCGLTFGQAGHWTSWSPHEHASSREEVYLYIDMPRPAFGLQMIYKDLHNVDFVEPVFEDDAVVITEGYHPNVGIPGYGINFVWIMAGIQPEVDRDWADMNFQPEFLD